MSIAQFEEDKGQYVEQLDIVVASLNADPDNAELLALKEELTSAISIIDESIAELRPRRAAPATAGPPPPRPAAVPPSPPPAPQATEKWSRENHPAYKKANLAGSVALLATTTTTTTTVTEEKEADVVVFYQVNDNVLAKWVSGDKGFYPARITSVTGSSTAPIYTVKFKSYDTVETLRSKDIRPIAQKRKADGTPVAAGDANGATPQAPSSLASDNHTTTTATSSSASASAAGGTTPPPPAPAPTVSNNGVVLSAAASLYPQPQPGQEGASDGGKPAKKFKKIKANKELEAGKSKWQDFNAKSKFAKSHTKKDSMFRTPDGVHGRVGFTGSGQTMRKDPTRSRHVYQPNEELD